MAACVHTALSSPFLALFLRSLRQLNLQHSRDLQQRSVCAVCGDVGLFGKNLGRESIKTISSSYLYLHVLPCPSLPFFLIRVSPRKNKYEKCFSMDNIDFPWHVFLR